ncbi:MAG: hypothetical protein HY961_00815 [Ignavibacteriae bacterium]|nr:hypothetical protein [Ignavibacteriota bacterium]
MVQDDDGFIWIGTLSGLYRYDGSNVTRFLRDPSDSNSLTHNYAKALTKDTRGNIWVGTFGGGVNWHDRIAGKIRRVQATVSEGVLRGVNTVKLSHNKEMIVAAAEKCIFKISTALGVVDSFRFPSTPQMINSRVSDFLEYENDKFIVTTTGGLFHLDLSLNAAERIKHFREIQLPPTANRRLRCIEKDLEENFWIGSADDLLIMQKKGFGFLSRHEYDTTGLLKNSSVVKIMKDSTGRMWIGTSSGLFVSGNRDKQMQHVRASAKPDSISSVSGLMVDHLGILWVGTQDNGLYQVYQPDITFQTIAGLQNFSMKKAIRSILEERPGVWLMGTISGLYRYSFSTQQFEVITFAESKNKPMLWCQLKDRNNGIWIGAMDGVYYQPSRESKFMHFQHDPQNEHSLPFNIIGALAEDEYGNIWMGAYGNSRVTKTLCYYSPVSKTITRITGIAADEKPSPLPGAVIQMGTDREHNLWIGAMDTGLYSYEISGNPPPQSTFTHYAESSAVPHKISHGIVSCLRVGMNERIWFGTVSGGVNMLDIKTDSVSWFTVRDGLASNLVYRIEEDDQGILWLSTDNGISRFDPSTKTFTNYDITSGLPTNNLTFYSSMKCADGTIVFGTNTGDVVYFNPNSFKNSLNTQPAVITDIRLFNKSLETGDASPLKKAAYLINTLSLSHNQSVISFELANMDYLNPDVFTYAYKLDGFDKNWNYVSDQHSITYTNLDAGEYTLMLKQANHLGIWNEKPTLMKLIITPPWWRTTWANGSYGVLLLAGLYSFRRYERRRDRLKQEAEFERVETEKRVQQEFSRQLIETQEVERSRLAGELHDSLVQNLLIAKNRSLLAQKKLAEPETVGKDLGDISSVLDEAIEEVRKIAHNLRPYQLDRLGVTRALQALVKKVDEASAIRFRADLDNVDSHFTAETGIILFRIVQEGITNILKHSGATEANVVMKGGDKSVELTITDNGKGLADASAATTHASGFGLSGIEQRCRMLKGSCKVVSGPNNGTTLTISIPTEKL